MLGPKMASFTKNCDRCGGPIVMAKLRSGRWVVMEQQGRRFVMHRERCAQRIETNEVIAAQQRRWKREGRL